MYTKSTSWIFPINIVVWATNSAGTAFKASFEANNNSIVFPFVNSSWAEGSARFTLALFAYILILYCKVRMNIYIISVHIKLIIYVYVNILHIHQIIALPNLSISHAILSGACPLSILFSISFCFFDLGIPSTVNISFIAIFAIGMYLLK